MFNGTESQDVCFNGIESHAAYLIGQSHKMCIFKVIFSMLSTYQKLSGGVFIVLKLLESRETFPLKPDAPSEFPGIL
jgi:hypothetical protein